MKRVLLIFFAIICIGSCASAKYYNTNLQVFSWDFFSQIYHDKEVGENIVVSPISLEMNLGMLLNGLKGNSKQELLKVLHLQGYETSEIDRFFKKMMDYTTIGMFSTKRERKQRRTMSPLYFMTH